MKLSRLLFISFFIIFFSFAFNRTVYAYTTKGNTVSTKVGNPPLEKHKDCSDVIDTNLASQVQTEFNVDISKLPPTAQRWTCNTIRRQSDTKFAELIKGSTISEDGPKPGYSDLRYCNNNKVNFNFIEDANAGGGQIDMISTDGSTEIVWSSILTHELGHALSMCNKHDVVKWNEMRNARDEEQGVSFYGQNASNCSPGTDNYLEDYAETVSIYFWRERGTTKCGVSYDSETNTFYGANGNTRPKHYSIITSVLGDFTP